MFKTKRTDSNVLVVDIFVKGRLSDWSFYLLCRSDAHHDNIHCRQDLELKHLKLALKRDAAILDIGDLHCAMQGKYDKRSNKLAIRPENMTGDYLDSLVNCAADFYEPFAKNWLAFGYGNHETAIMGHHETDLTKRLSDKLGDRTGHFAPVLGYTGWVKFQFHFQGQTESKLLWFNHGYGGGGPVSQDMIQAARQRDYITAADLMLSGHVHRAWVQEYIRYSINNHGKIVRNVGQYIKCPTYKDAYGKGVAGFEVEKGLGPRPLGAYWVRFFAERIEGKRKIQFEVIKAN